MGLASIKNDIKVLFLIVNSLCGLFTGLLSVAAGVAEEIVLLMQFSPVPVAAVAAGLLLLGLTALGYCGAILENRKMLIAYSLLMGVVSGSEVVAVALVVAGQPHEVTAKIKYYEEPEPPPHLNPFLSVIFTGLILHAAITLVATALAAILAKLMQWPTRAPHSPADPASPALVFKY